MDTLSIPVGYVIVAALSFFAGLMTAYKLTSGGAQSATMLTPPETPTIRRRPSITI